MAYYEDPVDRWDRQRRHGHERRPSLDPRRLIRDRLGYSGPISTRRHHASHAASSFYFSPFEGAAILTADGVGEWATTAYGVGSATHIDVVQEVQFPHSLGLFYAALTYWLGFSVNGGEGTVMALAALGRPRHSDVLSKLIRSTPGGGFEVDTRFFPFTRQMASLDLEAALGVARRRPASPLTEDHADLAASVQAVVEDIALEKIRFLRETTGADRLCLAGGVALNCVLGGRICREGGFEDVFVPPAPGDAGGALGAAALAYVERTGTRPRPLSHPFLGPDFEIEKYLAGTAVERHRHPSEEALISDAVDRLEAGEVIGWFQGRLEFGPRALGGRSLLADPRPTTVRDRINARIKNREAFRPFGLSVLEERAQDVLEGPVNLPWMQMTCSVSSALGAVRHVDGSTRPQLVSRDTEPRYWRLLKAWERRTGCPGLLNTSLNTRGEPLACSPVDALFTLGTGGFDRLYMDLFRIDALPPSWRPALSTWRGPPRRAGRPDLYSF